MTRRHSITLRLALGLSLMTGLLWLGAAAISTIGIQHAVNEAYDYALRQAANRLLPLAIHDLREPYERRRGDGSDDGDFRVIIRASDGTILVNDGGVPTDIAAEAPGNGYSETSIGRAYATTDRRSGVGIVVFEAENERHDAVAEAVMGLGVPLAGLLPLVGLGVWFALRLALRPLEKLRSDLAERDRHNLAPLDASKHPKELMPIAEEVINLLDRLRDALDAERAFAASSAHQLRTPIAGALAQTQLLAAELKGKPGEERTAEIERSLRRLASLAERLLQLARLEAGFARSDEVTDLVPVTRLITRDARRSGTEIEEQIAADATLKVAINPDAFALALSNLIDNAAKHGEPGKPIRVTVGPGASLTVSNEGPVVPGEVLASLGRPFVRGETTADGSGIGLSIVRSVMVQAGGTLSLQSPASGRADGFEARLDFAKA